MTETHKFAMLKGERLDEKSGYRLMGLPTGNKSFKEADEWTEIKASWLHVEGVGFGAESFEFSQHEVTIFVEQDRPGGPAKITFHR
jgi:hypothetical protein